VREEYKNTSLLWEGGFDVKEKIIIDYGDVKADLARYKERMKGRRIFRLRWMEN
jgi:hypothetical protein